MTFEDVRHAIDRVRQQVDFGEYEMEVYIAVLEHGELTPSEIADRTDVPQTRVYDTVRTLSDRGVVEIRESRPMRIVAVDPETVFPELREAVEEITQDLKDRYTAPTRDTEAVTLVKSRPTILRYLEDVIESAEHELMVSLTPDLLDRFESNLEAAREDDVLVELLVLGEAVPRPSEYDYERVATVARSRTGATSPVFAVADGQYSMFTTEDALSGGEDLYGVIFNRSELGLVLGSFFSSMLWSTAEALMYAEPQFPQRYTSLRRAIQDLQRSDGEYYATIMGRDTESERPRRVKGRIVDAFMERNGEIATLTLETDDGTYVDVGSHGATLEDVEARHIYVTPDEADYLAVEEFDAGY